MGKSDIPGAFCSSCFASALPELACASTHFAVPTNIKYWHFSLASRTRRRSTSALAASPEANRALARRKSASTAGHCHSPSVTHGLGAGPSRCQGSREGSHCRPPATKHRNLSDMVQTPCPAAPPLPAISPTSANRLPQDSRTSAALTRTPCALGPLTAFSSQSTRTSCACAQSALSCRRHCTKKMCCRRGSQNVCMFVVMVSKTQKDHGCENRVQ